MILHRVGPHAARRGPPDQRFGEAALGPLCNQAHATLSAPGLHVICKAGTHPRFERMRAHWDHPDLRCRLIDGDCTLLPGIELIETSGHVPGHQSMLVRLPQTGPVLLAIDAVTWVAQFDADTRELGPHDMDLASLRESTRKLVELARHESVALVISGHDAEQWPTLKKAPDYYC